MTLFVKRAITVEFQLGTGAFGEAGAPNTVRVSGLRVQCNVTQTTGGPAMGTAQIRIYGLKTSLLNQLASLQTAVTLMRQNTVTVMAGDSTQENLPVMFTGQIVRSLVDFGGAPDVCLNVIAVGGAFAALKPVAAISFPGPADTKVIFKAIADSMNAPLEYSGPSVILKTPNYSGTAIDQMKACAQHANLNAELDADGILAVWPLGGVRGAYEPLEVSAETGMIGYPSYSSGDYQGLAITMLFNPKLRQGLPVNVKTSLPASLVPNGAWAIFDISHAIESESPGGQWMSTFNARYLGPM